MKVLLVNTYDRGGAANSCKRLHLALLNQEVDSKVLLKFKQNNWPNSSSFIQPTINSTIFRKIEKKIKRSLKKLKYYDSSSQGDSHAKFLNSRQKDLELFSYPNSNSDITESPLYKEADIINLHWIADFLDFESFFKKNKKPVIWTLHDMNPFSGGEHYEEHFLGLNKNGYPITRERLEEEIKVSYQILKSKKQVLSKVDNLIIVAPSKWLALEAKKSEVFRKFEVEYIPYGLDPEIYKPWDQNFSRGLFNIPKEKIVILFVANSISNNRKGFIFLQKALEQLADDNLVLCAVGEKNSNLQSNSSIMELGPIKDERLLSIAYSAADVFVIPSLMDNLPNTVLESLMCGTPVIGFPIGGIPDMIQEGENGLLTKEISISSLVETLSEFLDSPGRFDRKIIRENAVEKYDQKIQAERYVNLFNKING